MHTPPPSPRAPIKHAFRVSVNLIRLYDDHHMHRHRLLLIGLVLTFEAILFACITLILATPVDPLGWFFTWIILISWGLAILAPLPIFWFTHAHGLLILYCLGHAFAVAILVYAHSLPPCIIGDFCQ